jgi:hypothetical protein
LTDPPLVSGDVDWAPDDSSKKCSSCGSKFGIFSRKHHCRHCGILACDACSPKRGLYSDPEGGKKAQKVRVCVGCVNKLLEREEKKGGESLTVTPLPAFDLETAASAPRRASGVYSAAGGAPLSAALSQTEEKAHSLTHPQVVERKSALPKLTTQRSSVQPTHTHTHTRARASTADREPQVDSLAVLSDLSRGLDMQEDGRSAATSLGGDEGVQVDLDDLDDLMVV